jgi:hypothetical protein
MKPKHKAQPHKGSTLVTTTSVRMIALKRHTYDRQIRKPGEVYEARPDMVRALIATGYARVDAEASETKPNEYNRRDMRARK